MAQPSSHLRSSIAPVDLRRSSKPTRWDSLAGIGRRGSGLAPGMFGVRFGRIGPEHVRAAGALLLGCLFLFVATSCGGGRGPTPTNESWRSGWREDSKRAPVGDREVFVDWYAFDEDPAWSPDGRWIAFDSTRLGGGIYVVRPDGRGLRRIAKSPSGGYPTWSPDSRWLAFSTKKGIVVVRRDGSARHWLIRRSRIGQVKWSADGRAIAFAVENTDGPIDVYLKDLNSGHTHSVVRSRPGRELLAFDWARSGHALVVQDRDDRIRILSLRNRSSRVVVNGDGSYEPAWSADQRQIAYQCAGELCTISTDGKNGRILTAVDGAGQPAWSPDGRWIVFTREISGSFTHPGALYRVSADGRHLRNITFGPLTPVHRR